MYICISAYVNVFVYLVAFLIICILLRQLLYYSVLNVNFNNKRNMDWRVYSYIAVTQHVHLGSLWLYECGSWHFLYSWLSASCHQRNSFVFWPAGGLGLNTDWIFIFCCCHLFSNEGKIVALTAAGGQFRSLAQVSVAHRRIHPSHFK